MLEEYYHAELAYYRVLAQEFARQYPEVEHMVSERQGDPSVERLLQGAALLTARMRARLDDDFPEIIHSLFETMWPQYLRPEPAVTLLQFRPRANVLRQSQSIAPGTEVEAEPVEGVQCTFRSSSRVELHPVQIASATLERPSPSDLQLHLRLEMLGGVKFDNVKLQSLRIHLLGEQQTRYTVYHWLCHHCRRVSVDDLSEGTPPIELPPGCIAPIGFDPSEHLFPGQPTMIPGLRYLEEFFTFPDKFLGVDLGGLNLIPPGRVDDAFEVVFHLGDTSEGRIALDTDSFALGCTPVINLIGKQMLELKVEPGINEYKLEAPDHGEVYSVEKVGAHDTRSNEWIDYPPLFQQGRRKVEEGRPRYQVLRRSDGVERVETYLAIRDAHGEPLEPPAEALHVEITYTNGNIPLRLGLGEVHVPTSSAPEYCEFDNPVGVSSASPLVLTKERHWELLALFSMHPADLVSRNGLQRLLQTCFDVRSSGSMLPRVVDVTRAIASRLHRQTVVPVTRVEITLDEESFASPGQAFLFARVLAMVLLHRPEDLAFTEVRVRCQPSGQEYIFRE